MSAPHLHYVLPTGFEPARGHPHALVDTKYARWDSNPHAVKHKNLNLGCLPIPPRALNYLTTK